MPWILSALVALSALTSLALFRNQELVENEVRSGRVKIRLGEDITGASYQIAISEVLGYVFALVAIIVAAMLMSYIGTRTTL